MRVKYPSTYHFDWSPGLQNDDRRIETTELFHGMRVIVSEKLDGECTTMYHDHIHARSLDSVHHPSREWVKAFWGSIKHEIPPDMRICGENVYAEHSLSYDDLETYFYGFSIWIGDWCLDWNSTLEWFELLGITPVPVWYDGVYDENALHEIWKEKDPDKTEGYVVRVANAFTLDTFALSVGKYVRRNHVQTDELWMNKPVVPNRLREHNGRI